MSVRSFAVVSGVLLAACGQQAAPDPQTAEVPAVAAHGEAAEAPAGFSQVLTAGAFSFRVESANAGSIGTVSVTPTGLSADGGPQQAETNGTVTRAETGDLDGDGFPEVYVFTRSAGSGSYGAALGWAVNQGKSMTPIMIPDLPDDPKLLQGYMGHDRFAIEKDRLTRSFPIYRDGDPNSAPTGGTRTLAYALKPGEAGWMMELAGTEDTPPGR